MMENQGGNSYTFIKEKQSGGQIEGQDSGLEKENSGVQKQEKKGKIGKQGKYPPGPKNSVFEIFHWLFVRRKTQISMGFQRGCILEARKEQFCIL